ncbi:MAG: tRNA (adenosine(37)-N6)-threonylcarbamoyltransferase complex dimerization subunit type 1 TsaB [Gammaproteobacteria bacterium]|nr:tRNA (adenosine(37)-N6)-threonylcarbamoyltransferase complex dimerization subunit type 1 TsaB [Gammaproteobacteria bacterium]MCZ6852456.1 tRNA (adenosine(37)-N6)-threonylcarbamoyltransferase complex dimerization subunit type 1 TsaB [Gammaproteobacteria bacterium]
MLGLDTSAALCSVAIYRENRMVEDTRLVERMHNRVVLEMIDGLCRRADIASGQLDAVAFACGPGSFTGIRISAAVAQGIAFANNALIYPIPSSLVLAHAARERAVSCSAEGVLTVIRSRKKAFYLAGYALDQGELTAVIDDGLFEGDDPPESLELAGWVVVGDEPPWWERVVDLRYDAEPKILASTVCELGLRRHKRGEGLDASEGLPTYVAGDSPWSPQS